VEALANDHQFFKIERQAVIAKYISRDKDCQSITLVLPKMQMFGQGDFFLIGYYLFLQIELK